MGDTKTTRTFALKCHASWATGLIVNYIIRDDLSPDSLDCLIIEITNPHSKPFLVGTWYRPPDSLTSKFIDFEDITAKIDSENRELFLLGDINVDLLPEVEAPNARILKDIRCLWPTLANSRADAGYSIFSNPNRSLRYELAP